MNRVKLRLAFVEPKGIHALVEIIFTQFPEHKFARFGVGRVHERLPAVKPEHPVAAARGAHKQIAVTHRFIVFAVFIYRRPHRHHKLCAQFVQFFGHRGHVRPILRVKTVVALLGPVEIIRHNRRKRYVFALIPPRDFQKLFLGFIAQSALPKAGRPVGHFRRVAGQICQCFCDFFGASADYDIIHPAGAVACPACVVIGKRNRPRGRVIPQKAVAERRINKRHGALRVEVSQVKRAAFQIPAAALVVTEPEEMLVFRRAKGHARPPQPALQALIFPNPVFKRIFRQFL